MHNRQLTVPQLLCNFWCCGSLNPTQKHWPYQTLYFSSKSVVTARLNISPVEIHLYIAIQYCRVGTSSYIEKVKPWFSYFLSVTYALARKLTGGNKAPGVLTSIYWLHCRQSCGRRLVVRIESWEESWL